MVLLGDTTSQIIANSRLAFIFPNGPITHNQIGVYFQSPTPIPMRVPNDCSFETLKSIIQNTLQLTNDQLVDEIYYQRKCSFEQYFFNLYNQKIMMMFIQC